MRIQLCCCAVASIVAFFALPVVVSADEADKYNNDAEYAESTPPMIPHRFKDTSDGEYCLGCHRTGINDAPMTPHPERLSCTGCHAQGEIKEVKPLEKGKKK